MGLFDSVGNLLGVGSGSNSGFQASGLTPDQLNAAYGTTNGAISQQQALANALAGQGTQGINSQNQLTAALQQQAAGGGPNPAQAALNQSTGQNIASQAALMAGQRGASANPALIARQAAQQGAATQQQAVGQGATLQAQQQLAAQQQLQNLAATQVGQQSGAVGNLNQYALQNQGQLTGLQENQNSVNGGMAQTNANNTAKTLTGLVGGLGSLGSSLGGMFSGGSTAGTISGAGSGASYSSPAATPYYFKGGEVTDPYQAAHEIYHGGHYENKSNPKLSQVPESDRFMKGGKIGGDPKVNHDDPKNDTVDIKASPGEVVIDLDTLKRKDQIGDAARLVAEALSKKNGGNNKQEESQFKGALKDAIKSRKKNAA